jgi:hypothetical protein
VLRKKDENPKGKSEIPIFLSGADEAVVVLITLETGQERRASHEEVSIVLQLNEN